jgi:hypothetical protein
MITITITTITVIKQNNNNNKNNSKSNNDNNNNKIIIIRNKIKQDVRIAGLRDGQHVDPVARQRFTEHGAAKGRPS